MKRVTRKALASLLGVFCTVAALGSIFASAYDLTSVQPDSAVMQSAEESLQDVQAELLDSTAYTVRDSAYYEFDHSLGISGYDLDKAVNYYTLDSYMVTKYAENQNLGSLLSETPQILLPYENEGTAGVIYLSEDISGQQEFAGCTIHRRGEAANEYFDLDAIETALTGLESITDVKLAYTSTYKMNLVYVVANGTEYVIPYYLSVNANEYEGMAEGELHTTSSFMGWLTKNFDNHPGTMNIPDDGHIYFGEGVTYIGTQRRLAISFGVAGAFLACASVGCVLYRILQKRSHTEPEPM